MGDVDGRNGPVAAFGSVNGVDVFLAGEALAAGRVTRHDSAPWGGGLRIGVESRAVINESC